MSTPAPFPGARPETRQGTLLHSAVVARTPFAGAGIVQRSTPNGVSLTALGSNRRAKAETHPFKLSLGSEPWTIKVAPGILYISGTAVTPKIGSVDIDAEESPLISIGTGSYNILLGFRVEAVFGEYPFDTATIYYVTRGVKVTNTNAIIIANKTTVNPPGERLCAIDYSDGTSEYGQFYVSLGRVTRTTGQDAALTIDNQYWKTNIAAALQGNGDMFYAVR